MSRGNLKDAYYFSHDSNARNDEKIMAMRSVYGLPGYAMYFMIVEILREQSNYKIKDGKYKFDIISLQRFETPSQYITGGWKNVLVFTTGITEEELSKILFKKDGTLKKQYITVSKSADYFNSINESLLKYITSSNKEKKDWETNIYLYYKRLSRISFFVFPNINQYPHENI